MGLHYSALEASFKRLADIEGATAILSWDTAVMMPRAASAQRGDQLASLRRVAHDLLTSTATAEHLAAAEAEQTSLQPEQMANLREMRRRHLHGIAVDPALVEALTRAANSCEMLWREARAKSDFPLLRSALEEVVRLAREEARQKGAALGLGPYDALLDAHQPDLRDAAIAPLFATLEDQLPPLLEAATARPATAIRPLGPFPVEAQRAMARRLMARLGFDFDAGRLDESAHPFCGGLPGDIRITTRYREDEVVSAIMGVLHETGHALYEAGLPLPWRGQPAGEARGIAIHESQSLLVEMQACRSPAFVRHLAGELKAAFGPQPAFAPANLEALYARVERSLIRVDADEVTYPLHVVLRHRLERALIGGDLAVADLPAAWNDGMAQLLGVVPPDDARGCLQDIHWPVGAFGYFPCYTLGAMLAAQLFAAARHDLPELDAELERGEFGSLRAWLGRRVHGRGSLLPYAELVQEATGAPLAADAFIAHLRGRYLELGAA